MTGWSLSPPLADPRLHLAHLLFKSPVKSHHSKPNIPTPQEQSKKQPSLQESQGEKPSLLEFGVWKAMRTIAALTVLPHSPEDLCVLQIFTEKPVLVDVECCFSPQCCAVLFFCSVFPLVLCMTACGSQSRNGINAALLLGFSPGRDAILYFFLSLLSSGLCADGRRVGIPALLPSFWCWAAQAT